MNSIEDALMTFADTEPRDQGFPLNALPPAFVSMVEALMDFFKIDPILPVMSVLGINSSALGAGLQVRSNKAITRGNLYQIVGAGSGTCKTLVQSIVQEPGRGGSVSTIAAALSSPSLRVLVYAATKTDRGQCSIRDRSLHFHGPMEQPLNNSIQVQRRMQPPDVP